MLTAMALAIRAADRLALDPANRSARLARVGVISALVLSPLFPQPVAFRGTLGRAWEFSVGVLLAIVMGDVARSVP